jgi:peptide-methionine (S)-S-oxide reductase
MFARSFATSIALLLSVGVAGLASAQDAPAVTKPAAPKAKTKATTKDTKAAETKVTTEKATLGGGCFWCQEAVFEALPGVKSVVSGYSGGFIKNPSYAMVSSGETGHAEVVQIEFDPDVIPYEKLLEVFFHAHDPTTLNMQGPDEGTQYRSIILYHSEAQRLAAKKIYDKLTADGSFAQPIVTQLEPFKAFYAADKHHQDYYKKNGKKDSYCKIYIAPKLKKLGLDKK